MSKPAPDPVYILRGLGSPVTALEFCLFSEDQHRLISGDQKGIVNIWNLASKRTEFTLNGHKNSVLNVQCLKTNTILSHGRDGYVLIWNFDKGRPELENSFEVSNVGFCKCEVLYSLVNSGLSFAVAGRQHSQIDIVCSKTKNIVRTFKPDGSKSFGMCMCLKEAKLEDGAFVLAGYENGDIVLWDLNSSHIVAQLNIHKGPVMCIDFDSTSQRGITGSAEDEITVFRIREKRDLEVEKVVGIKNPGISSVKIRQDCKIVATGGWDHKLRIFSWKTLKPLAILNYHTKSVDCLAFWNSEQHLLAAGSKDGRISLWSLY